MAGMAEALGLMIAGGAGQAADRRASDIREEEKAGIAAAREQSLARMKANLDAQNAEHKAGLDRETDRLNNEFKGAENQKDRDSRMSIASMQEAGANSRNSATIAGANERARLADAGGIDGKTGKRLQGTPTILKDEAGSPTGQVLYNFRDGSSEIRTLDEIPGGNKPTKAEKQILESDADKYAKQRVGEMSGLFTSDKEAFKDYGGSKAKATEHFRKEFMAGRTGGDDTASGGGDTTPAEGSDRSSKTSGGDITQGMDSTQSSLFNQAKAALPGYSDEQILQALVNDERYGKFFTKSQ